MTASKRTGKNLFFLLGVNHNGYRLIPKYGFIAFSYKMGRSHVDQDGNRHQDESPAYCLAARASKLAMQAFKFSSSCSAEMLDNTLRTIQSTMCSCSILRLVLAMAEA